MSLELFTNNGLVNLKWSKFPAGETHLRILDHGYSYLENMVEVDIVQIVFNFEHNGELFDLLLLVDAIRREFGKVDMTLRMSYLPYARQDRVCNPGESLSIKVVADLINSMNFEKVVCENIHSDVGVALINNLIHVDIIETASGIFKDFPPETTVLVSPDAGAMKKTLAFAKTYGYPHVICAEKQRDTLTGEIKGITIPDTWEGLENVHPNAQVEFLVLDDICDGGRTFVELAKALNETYRNKSDSLSLYVTHGIFSNGLSELQKYYTNIYTSNLMSKDETVKRGVICI